MNFDIIKFFVVITGLFVLNTRLKSQTGIVNLVVMNAGLCLLLIASFLDFTDGFHSLDQIPVIGKKAPLHDLIEDQFADTPGIALFIWGAFRAIATARKK